MAEKRACIELRLIAPAGQAAVTLDRLRRTFKAVRVTGTSKSRKREALIIYCEVQLDDDTAQA